MRQFCPARTDTSAKGPLHVRAKGRVQPVQRALKLGAQSDPAEREAERMADRVSKAPIAGKAGCSCGGGCAACRDKLSPRETPAAGGAPAPKIVSETVSAPGQPLPETARAELGAAFGADLSGIRVHTGAQATASANAISARAYTVGSDIVFNRGAYQPGSANGRRLIAHEVTHVLQQRAAPSRKAPVQRQEQTGGDDSTSAAPTAAASHQGCDQTQTDQIEAARRAAAIRCQVAAHRVRGIVPPGRPGAPDRGEIERRRAERLARKLFGERLNMGQVGDIVAEMGHKLSSTPRYVCSDGSDEHCGQRDGYVIGYRKPVYLCPQFFTGGSDRDENRIRTLVHEAAHLSGIGEHEGESYCIFYDCDAPCGSNGFDVADNWSHFVHCLSGQTPDVPPG